MRTGAATASILLAGLLAFVPPGLVQGQVGGSSGLQVELRPRQAEVGDLIVASFTVEAPPEAIAPPVFPDWDEAWGEAEVREAGAVESLGGSRFRQEITLAVFRTGEVTLPAVTVEVPTADDLLILESQPATLEIRSVLPPDVENPEPRPPAPPRALPMGESFLRTTAVLAAACLVAAYFLSRRHRSQALRAETSTLAPLEALTRGLEALSKVEDGEAFHTGLSLHLRRFLGRSFGFPALESTTTEIRQRLTDAGTPRGLVGRAEKLLRHCDLVKFAHGVMATEPVTNSGSRLDEALSIGRELDRHLHPPEPAAAEQDTERAA